MSFGFDKLPTGKVYLKRAGEQENAKFISLTYDATEAYEYFDISIETESGETFRERTFGPNKEKVYPKQLYKNNVKDRMETIDEAFERVQQEINTKLFHLASCFTTKDVLTEKVRNVSTLKGLVEAVNKAIGTPEGTINFLTIWKNSDAKQKSNLIIAERIKWVEPHVPGKKVGISLTKYQIANQLVEKYPYNGGATNTGNHEESLIEEGPVGAVGDLPF